MIRRALAAFGLVVTLAGAASMTVLSSEETKAADRAATFIVPANDGYGVGDCLASGTSCGRVVADAWCEAQGFTRSVSINVAEPEDVTGAIAQPVAAASRPISITCGQ